MFMFWPVHLSVRFSANFKFVNNLIYIRYNTHIWYMYSSVQSHLDGKHRSSCDLDITYARPICRVPRFYDVGYLRSSPIALRYLTQNAARSFPSSVRKIEQICRVIPSKRRLSSEFLDRVTETYSEYAN